MIEQYITILCDANQGVNIPKIMIERLKNAGWKGISLYSMHQCKTPYNPFYWDEWNEVLDRAYLIDNEGLRWALYQDGDLFAYRMDKYKEIIESNLLLTEF